MTKAATPAASAWADWVGFSLDGMTTGVTVPPVTAAMMPARVFARSMPSRSAVRETSTTACRLSSPEIIMSASKRSAQPSRLTSPLRMAWSMALFSRGSVRPSGFRATWGTSNPRVNHRSGQGLGANGAFVLPALQVADLTFYGVEPPVGQTVGLLLGFVGFLLRLVEFPLGLDEAVEPAG